MEQPVRQIGIVGFGAIGQGVAAGLDKGVPGAALAAITSRDLDAARDKAQALLRRVPPVVPLDDTVRRSDLVVEAAPAAAFDEIATAALSAGKVLLVASVGALVAGPERYAGLARRHGGSLHVISGAIGGLDAISAAAMGSVESVTMTTRKPPRGLVGAPYLEVNGIDLTGLTAPRIVFEGSARDACRGFPANVNVSAAVSLAGIGPDRTQVRIIADPSLDRNMHDVDVVGDFGRFTVHIENRPTANPRTGALTAMSILATIRRLSSPLRVG
ncbi:MAG TPA: aspartate dehydrogenase [bacterium]|nr:aspartate dehydrogenase [bacterium]